MAYQSDSRMPLFHNMREKNECSRPAARKKASSLRIPDDTSWPKIPERRLHDNVVNNSKVPCFVALAGKPQKNRTVELPHSQFIKAAPKKDGLLERNAVGGFAPLQATAAERYASSCKDSKFKTTISPQITSSDTLKNYQNKPIEQSTRAATEHPERPGDTDSVVTLKKCQVNTLRNSENSHNQFSADKTLTENIISRPSIMNNEEIDASSDDFKIFNTNSSSQETVKMKLPDGRDSTDSIKRESALPAEYQWTGKSRPSRPPMSDTTDSELYSSDTTKTGGRVQVPSLSCLRSNPKEPTCENGKPDYARKCCYKPSKCSSKKKDELDSCPCSRCIEKCRSPLKYSHHSEPQIGSRRCSTGHGACTGRLCCCRAKELSRVASDSDCLRGVVHSAGDYPRSSLNNKFDEIGSCPAAGALKALFIRENAAAEFALKAQMLMQKHCDFEVDRVEVQGKEARDGHYDCQLEMGPPLVKRRKSDADGRVKEFDTTARISLESASRDDYSLGRKDNVTSQVPAAATGEDAATNIKNSTLSLCSSHTSKSNPQGEKQADNRLLKLKTAVFLGCLMYALILSLPALYDYFFYEDEYDSYEELTYIEIILDYIVSSFQEAFGGLFDLISKVFFQSRTCKKCSNAN